MDQIKGVRLRYRRKELFIKTRTLGSEGLEVSSLGLGCMGMSEFYGRGDEGESIATIHRALDLGINFLDTADMYGPFTNEQLVGRAIRDRRDDVVLATKSANVRGENGEYLGIRGDADYVRQACDDAWEWTTSISTTSTAWIPTCRSKKRSVPWPNWSRPARYATWACRKRPRRPCAVRMQCIRSARCRPSIRCGAATWRTASCRRCGNWVSATSPTVRLGGAFLPGRSSASRTCRKTTTAATPPRFQAENFQKNLDLISQIEHMACEKGCTPAQLALAWVLAQGDDIVPIPGTKRRQRLEDNIKALDVRLSTDDLARIDPGCVKTQAPILSSRCYVKSARTW
uniref:Putative aldo/keto reductase protein n=2 Tax=Pseudomonas TaxID=286 RepID=Q1XGM4_PSEPU|nr:putative aldo/keto reductase protein [Pseudomonas sp. MC1]BAE92152.1 putative aldo/keto reductase protein [Pseudomonas putida]